MPEEVIGNREKKCDASMQDNGIISDLLSVLKYHNNSGITHYQRNAGITCFLQSLPGKQRESAGVISRTAPPVSLNLPGGTAEGREEAQGRVHVTLADIADEVAVCRACSLAGVRLGTRAGTGGGKQVRLLVVGDWLRGDPDVQLPGEVQFGIEEDRMLIRMFAAINLQPTQVFVTNVIKCVIPTSCQPIAENIQTCLSFLYRQIALLAPEVICAMGIVAARALLGLPQPLSKLRGRFHMFSAEDSRQIPVLATYHPGFLLQNPEMKQAAWLDLQILGRHLQTLQ
jgi:uracil-DNA glycosylase